MPRITKAQVIVELAEIVADKGLDYVDPNAEERGCEYGLPGAPSCIVGHVFDRYGLLNVVPPHGASLLSLSDPYSDAFTGSAARAVREKFTPKALRALSAAQAKQDIGKTWGEALMAAAVAA